MDTNNKMYTEHAEEYQRAIKNNSYNAKFDRPSLISLLPELKDKVTIDIGCGPGEFSKYLLSQGAAVTAVDVSMEMVEISQKETKGLANCYQQDLAKGIPLEKDESFDLAISALTLHYISDFNALFDEVSRILKPEGQFIFSTNHPIVDFASSPSGNYFCRELIQEEWKTVGEKVKVEYFRRPLSETFEAIRNSGMVVELLNEGKPDDSLKETDPQKHLALSTKPTFIYLKCRKLGV